MKKQYSAPTLTVQAIELGVFGDYGNGGGGGGNVRPDGVTERFDIRMD